MVDEASGSGGMKLEPYMIPKLHEAFQSALDQLAPALQESCLSFRIAKPAMADAASVDFQNEFNNVADDAGAQLAAYRQRLQDVVRTLDDIQRAYDRNEYDTAVELSSQLEP